MRTERMVDLRQNLTQIIRDVERGETVIVTDRDRPVAVLGPIPGVKRMEPREVVEYIESLNGGSTTPATEEGT